MMHTDIRFGTDGWRAVIADTFTVDNVRALSQAMADYINHQKLSPGHNLKKAIIGYDRRFMSDYYAKVVSEVFAANKIMVYLVNEPTSTPAVSFAIKSKTLDAGVVITASHNPPIFSGIKFKTHLAISADESTTKEIESFINQTKIRSLDFNQCIQSKQVEYFDAKKDYIKFLKKYVDVASIRKFKPKVLIDYMHGAGVGCIEAVLGKLWPGIETVRRGVDPLFGGVNPEPIPTNLELSSDYMKKNKFHLGVALDGDADRIGALRSNGKFISSGETIALILLHFLEDRKLTGDVVKTISGTTLIEKICKKHNLTMFETPVGFKYISALMLKENILIGGEESGGIGFCGYIPERDGVLSALLLMEMMAHRKKSIDSILASIEKEYGKFAYNRIDVEYPFEKAKALTERLINRPLKKIAGRKVVRLKTYDGIKFIMDDESWLLLRFSGTEPVLRIYAESSSDLKVKKLIDLGKGIADR